MHASVYYRVSSNEGLVITVRSGSACLVSAGQRDQTDSDKLTLIDGEGGRQKDTTHIPIKKHLFLSPSGSGCGETKGSERFLQTEEDGCRNQKWKRAECNSVLLPTGQSRLPWQQQKQLCRNMGCMCFGDVELVIYSRGTSCQQNADGYEYAVTE